MAGEIRIPNRLLIQSLANKESRALRLFATAKLDGHRSQVAKLSQRLKIKPRTMQRLIKQIVARGWAGCDGTYIFPRSWQKIDYSKKGGLYMTKAPTDLKKFEAMALAKGLKSICRKGGPHLRIGEVLQTDFPTGFLCAALGIKERRFKTLKAAAQRYKFIFVKPQYKIIGRDADYPALRKNLPGLPIFKKGRKTVCPDVSRIQVLI